MRLPKQIVSRRSLLSGVAASAVVASAATSAEASPVADSVADLTERQLRSRAVRQLATEEANIRPFTPHETNKDEEGLQPKYIGNFYKGLPQDQNGIVDTNAYEKLLKALSTGNTADFDAIPLGKIPQNAVSFLAGEAHIQIQGVEVSSTTRFYRTAADIESGAASIQSVGVSDNEPRFYRIHSERAATLDGKSLLVDPQAALGFDLEGDDSHSFHIPAPPSYSSSANVAEIAENYWMAILRDTPFHEFEIPGNSLVSQALSHLNSFSKSDLDTPRDGGQITGENLFRGTTAGDLIGPYVSQFLLRDVSFGAYSFPQQVKFGYPKKNGVDQTFLINEKDWYASQLGVILPNVTTVSGDLVYNYRPRELCNFVHIDELFQGYLNAELIMSAPPTRGGLGVELGMGNPYRGSTTQVGFGTLGEPNFASLVAEVATRALKAVWFQKWSVHRRLRPEAFAGHIHFKKLNTNLNYPFHSDWEKSLDPVLQAVKSANTQHGGNGYFLPMAFQDGAPSHPAYGAGHATVAGACVTLLKAFYDDTPFSRLMSVDPKTKKIQVGAEIFVASNDGKSLISLSPANKTDAGTRYKYDDLKDKMTIHGELNKVASNVSLARNFAGVHWRSDHAASVPLGEQVAIKFLKQVVQTYNENVSFSFKSFSGDVMKIEKV